MTPPAQTRSRPGSRPRPPARRRSSLWILAAVAALIVVALVIAIVATRGGDGGSEASSTVPAGQGGTSGGGGAAPTPGAPVATAPVTVTGTALPPFQQTQADPAVGQRAPDLQGYNVLDGTPLSITADGKPKLIFLVAHWCPHCQREVPLIQDWLSKNGAPQGVELYAISTSVSEARGNYPPAAWLTKEKWSVPTMADSADSAAGQAMGLTSIPYFVAVDGTGKVVERATGEQPISAIEDMIARLTG